MSSASVWYFCKKIIPQNHQNAYQNKIIKSSIFDAKIVKCEADDKEFNLNIWQIDRNNESYFTRMSFMLQMPFEN